MTTRFGYTLFTEQPGPRDLVLYAGPLLEKLRAAAH
jgi:hypothetical protein